MVKEEIYPHSTKCRSIVRSDDRKHLVCCICKYSSYSWANLKSHTFLHTGEKPFACTYCDYRTGHKTSLVNHIRTHTGEKPYQCNFCEYKSSQSGPLRYHMKLKHGQIRENLLTRHQ